MQIAEKIVLKQEYLKYKVDKNSSYTKNYFKIYLWKGFSIVLNFLSMFVVLPLLSADKISYGVYAICTSFAVFFSYSDLGFIAAGQKYAAESFARGNKEEERKYIGFVIFIFLVFVALLAIFILFLSSNPSKFIKNLNDSKQITIASRLFLILALFSPVYILQRINQIIYSVRIEDYIPHRTYIIASVLKILSVFIFFNSSRRDIVGYFLTMQIISLLAEIVNLIFIKVRYSYDLLGLLSCITFNKQIFNATKQFAANSLFLTISWIVFYEMDTVMVGKLLGAEQVALFAIALSLATFFRTILGTFYAPYSVRFYHFSGNNDVQALKDLLLKIINISAPFIFIAIGTTVILSKQLIITWVGPNYNGSILLTQLLIMMNLFAFVSYPVSMALMALERLRSLYIIYFIMPVVYWGGVLFSYKIYGVNSFGLFKTISFYITVFYSVYVINRVLDFNLRKEILTIARLIVLPVIIILVASLLIRNVHIYPKRINLLIVAVEAIIIGSVAFASVFILNKGYYKKFVSIIRELNLKFLSQH